MHDDSYWMGLAIEEAKKAASIDEVPVGAVIVVDDQAIASSHNLRETENDPTAHAEVLALRSAGKKLSSWRIENATMYVTCEPCSMCAGALVLSRINKLVFGCRDPKAGACGSIYDIVREDRLNHRIEVVEGVLEKECSNLLSDYFRKKRK